jgi:hypothetical protein
MRRQELEIEIFGRSATEVRVEDVEGLSDCYARSRGR